MFRTNAEMNSLAITLLQDDKKDACSEYGFILSIQVAKQRLVVTRIRTNTVWKNDSSETANAGWGIRNSALPHK